MAITGQSSPLANSRVRSLFLTDRVLSEHSRFPVYRRANETLNRSGVDWTIAAFREKAVYSQLSTFTEAPYYNASLEPAALKRYLSLRKQKCWPPNHFLIGGYARLEYWLAWAESIVRKIPVTVYTGAGPESTHHRDPLHMFVKKLFLAHAKSFVTYGSKATANLLQIGIPKERIFTATNVSRVLEYKKLSRDHEESEVFRSRAANYPHPIIIYAGRLVKEKGLPQFLELLREMHDQSYYLFVAGQGALENYVRESFDSGRIRGEYLGMLTPVDLVQRLTEADVYVCPTLNDPFTRSLSEALSCGCYCLSSRYDDASYDLVCKGNGHVFDPLDSITFKQVLRMVLDPMWHRPDRKFIRDTITFDENQYGDQIAQAILYALK